MVAVAADTIHADRVGLGWRDVFAAGIFSNLEQVDVVEVIAEDYMHASRAKRRALCRLARTLPVTLHGVAMGLASTLPVPPERMQRMARLVAEVEPESWSEHLAFVRAGGIEIGHLAAPPRTAQTVAGAIANIEAATRIVGSVPQLENIATLIDPPCSTIDEAQWVGDIIRGSGAPLLLDLHNLYANAVNFGQDPADLLLRFPLQQVKAVHLSGGVWIKGSDQQRRLLDDHLHDPPPQVYDLLALLAQHAPQALTVTLERDGHFPDFNAMLEQLALARQALQRGRQAASQEKEQHELAPA